MPISSGLCVNTHLLWLIFTPVSLSVCVTFAVSVSPAITLVLLGSIVAFAGAVSSLTVVSCGLLACSPSVILTYTVWPFSMPSIIPPSTGIQLPSSVPPIWYSIVTSGSVVLTVTFAVPSSCHCGCPIEIVSSGNGSGTGSGSIVFVSSTELVSTELVSTEFVSPTWFVSSPPVEFVSLPPEPIPAIMSFI